MAVSQRELALQMVSQLRLLDPSVSAEVGTPERKILDTVAQALYDNQIDLDSLSTALDVDSKYGAALERFLALFGFARQKATFSTGFATFSRVTPSTIDIRIPANMAVIAPGNGPYVLVAGDPSGSTNAADIPFTTLFDVTLPAGSLTVQVPIRAGLAGNVGNVAANRINEIGAPTVFGITGVTNAVATTGGKDEESDVELKVRFRNTVFRNLAGTQDQYMALSIATAFTSKANVVGPQSYYREYIQVPPVADNGSYDVNGDQITLEAGNGLAGEYTSALSTIPYAKFVYSTALPVFVSNGESGLGSIFYRQDTDFRINYLDVTARNRGDTYRLAQVGLGATPALTGLTQFQPNITFTNIYTGVNPDVQAIRPGDVVLLEYAYMSDASRNDFGLKITNAVDVFIDGGNDTLASTVTSRPTSATTFVDDPISKFHYENYRRIGEPEKRPVLGNVFLPLFWQPSTDVPAEIVVGTSTYRKGEHYWGVYDISGLSGTIRARNGIEWSTKVFGKLGANPEGLSNYTGQIITDPSGDPVGGQAIEIADYTYDKNIVDLQASLVGSKQVTTDVLAHTAKIRYFKLDITVMYAAGAPVNDTNTQVQLAVDAFLRGQYFGSAIQLSDLLQVIHSVPGIDNVRWTSDTPNSPDLVRVFETSHNGAPLLNVWIDRVQPGNAARPEIQGLYITGNPTSGNFVLSWGGNSTIAIPWNTSAANIQTQLGTLAGIGALTVTEDTRSTTGVRVPIRSFRITWSANGAKTAITSAPAPAGTTVLAGGPYVIKNDFFLRDDELARLAETVYTPTVGVPDTVPGLIIRPRAQNTWVRTN